MKILVSNVGSTSLKFKLFEMPAEELLCEAKIERVGSETSAIYSYKSHKNGAKVAKDNQCIPTYATGIQMFLSDMTTGETAVVGSVEELKGVGFKTVLAKGFYGVHELTPEVIKGMEEYLFIAPAHNAPYLEAVDQFNAVLPGAKKIGVFETAFHTTIPLERTMYSIPYEWYEKYGIKRMGYHGASHGYIAEEARRYGEYKNLISCHLGGSCSVCAIQDGKSVDSSFGFSLQNGVPHANRNGDIDPYIVPFLMNEGLTLDEILKGLSKNGGLLGVSGVSNDLRDVQEAADAGNERAKLAIDMFVTSIVRFIGTYYAELGGLDKITFTGGIGEHSATLRKAVCDAVKHLGIELDEEANANLHGEGVITKPESKVQVVVITANEELGVARRTYENCI